MVKTNRNRSARSTSTTKPPSTVLVVSPGKPRRKKSSQKTTRSLPPYVELMVNPFTGPKEGASPPDENSVASLVWEDTVNLTVTPNADGDFMVQINPYIAALITTYTIVSGLTTAAGVTSSINYSTLSTTFSQYRPLCTCVEVEYIGQHDAAKGIVGIATGNMGQVTVGSSLNILTDERNYKEVSISALHSCAAVAKQSHSDFNTVTDTSSNTGQVLHYIYIAGSGLPATACIRIRARHLGDYIARVSSLLQSQASYSPHHPPQLATANSIVGPNTETAGGSDPVTTLTRYRKQAATIAGELNGLFQTARAFGPVLAEFAALMA